MRFLVPLRILTTDEFNNSLKSLFPGLTLDFYDLRNRDGSIHGFVRNSDQKISDNHLRDFAAAAESVANIVSDNVKEGLGCESEDCAFGAIEALATKAYRRPLEDPEIEALSNLYNIGNAEGGHKEGVAYVIEALVQSPSFLYVFENPHETQLNSDEIAQLMAFMYTQSLPDPQLLKAAQKGELETSLGRVKEARRLLDSDAGHRAMEALITQWFSMNLLKSIEDDPALYENAKEETSRFIEAVLSDSGSWKDLLTSDYTIVNQTMADHYGFDLNEAQDLGQGWYKYKPNYAAGLLTQAMFLSVKGTASVYRGKVIWERLLCGEVPAPPGMLKAIDTFEGESERSIANKRLNEQGCGSCHALMEPHALALDPFDGLGRYREQDSFGNPLTSQGYLLNKGKQEEVTDAKDLGATIVTRGEVRACLSKHIFTWAFARAETKEDSCSVFDIEHALLTNNDNIKDAMIQVVASEEFIRRK